LPSNYSRYMFPNEEIGKVITDISFFIDQNELINKESYRKILKIPRTAHIRGSR
jgi:hypothetical protein